MTHGTQVLRTPALDQALVVTTVLSEDGGYYPSTTLCQSNRELEAIAASLELTKPEHAVALGRVLTYLMGVQKTNKCVISMITT